MKMPMAAADDMGIYVMRAERCRKCPSRIHAAEDHHVQLNAAAYDEEIPARKVEPGKGNVACPNHERDKKVPQYGRRYGHQKEEHHDDAVNREQLVVSVRRNQIAGRSQQFKANQRCRHAANHKKENRGE